MRGVRMGRAARGVLPPTFIMTTRAYDVVLYGASGFTGSLAAQYLAEHPQQPKVAFAGRNEAKIR